MMQDEISDATTEGYQASDEKPNAIDVILNNTDAKFITRFAEQYSNEDALTFIKNMQDILDRGDPREINQAIDLLRSPHILDQQYKYFVLSKNHDERARVYEQNSPVSTVKTMVKDHIESAAEKMIVVGNSVLYTSIGLAAISLGATGASVAALAVGLSIPIFYKIYDGAKSFGERASAIHDGWGIPSALLRLETSDDDYAAMPLLKKNRDILNANEPSMSPTQIKELRAKNHDEVCKTIKELPLAERSVMKNFDVADLVEICDEVQSLKRGPSKDVESSARLRKLILEKCNKYPAFGDQHIGFDVNAEPEQIIETVSNAAKFITRKTAEKTKELFDISNKPISLPEVPGQFGALIETGMHTAADAIDAIKRSLSHSTQRSAYRFLSNFDDNTGMPRDNLMAQPNSPQPQAQGGDIQDIGELPPLRSVISRPSVNSGELDGSSNALVSSDSAIKLGAFRERREPTAPAVASTNRHKLG